MRKMLYNQLKARTAEMKEKRNQLAEVNEEINSGDYSAVALKEKMYPKQYQLRREIERIEDQAEKECYKMLDDYIEELRAQDNLNPAEITEDVKLLNCGVKLLPRDLQAMLDRNKDNRTMQQIVIRYAEENGIDMGGLRYTGNMNEIRAAEDIKYVIHLYTGRWMRTDKAEEMLVKFLGIDPNAE